jgi:exopolyphosphatase/pppGpp-phosphohydrolase
MTADGRVVAAIDIGSNTLKLTVARVSDGKVTPIASTAEVVRLSTDLGQTGRLREDRMQHAIDVLRDFVTIAREYEAGQIIAVGTAATRSAANGAEFLDRVKNETGIDVDVISGGEEARLTSNGVLAQIDPAGMILIVDIGGASTELIAVRDGIRLESASLGIGSGVLTDRFVGSDPPRDSELDHVERETARLASAFLGHYEAVDRLVLVGGVGDFLFGLLQKTGYIDATALDTAREIVLGMTAADLAPVINAPVARARVLPTGFAIARAICRESGAPLIESVANGLRIGILLRVAASGAQEESPR